jgi:DNA-binding MarR family transcriptional regulator
MQPFLLFLNKENGKVQKDIAELLCITPPTLTRLIEKLTYKGYVQIISEGRTKRIYLTDKGRNLLPDIQEAWNDLHIRYKALLGDDYADNLASIINLNAEKLR